MGLGYELKVVFSSYKIFSRCTIFTKKSEHLCKKSQEHQFAMYFKGTL